MVCTGLAEEKNGILMNASKNKLGYRKAGEGSERMHKVQGLGITLRNNTIRNFAEGEVNWTLLVKRSYGEGSYKSSSWYIKTGTEVLKPLRGSESVELFLTEVNAGNREQVEYDIIVTHGDSETIRITTQTNFDALAKTASNYRLVMDAQKLRGKQPGEKPGEGGKPVVAQAGEKPGDPTAMPPKEGAIPPKDTPGVASNPTPTESDPALQPAKPFDFFNLANTKKKPAGE